MFLSDLADCFWFADGRGSDTEYESYDDEDDDEDEDVLYINQNCETVDKEKIHLPK